MSLKQIVRAVWRKAYAPGEYVEGRIPQWLAQIFTVLIIMSSPWAGAVAGDPCRMERLYGTTLAKLFAGWYLLLSALTVGMSVYMVVRGYRAWYCRTTVPEGEKPLFRTRLVEGAAAVKVGLWTMLAGVLFGGVICFFLVFNFHPISTCLFNMPNLDIKGCQAR